MSFFKRLFSADYRAALTAEAAGNLDMAAERYALAGEHEAAVRVHLARAERSDDRAETIAALRDALHWATDVPGELVRAVQGRLGTELLAKARAEGVATERDRARVREAAELLVTAGRHRAAGEAYESIGDHRRAAAAYRDGGLVGRMEYSLAAEEAQHRAARELRDAFSAYKMHIRVGERDQARDALRRCVGVADSKGEYRRLLDELESRLITGGRVTLRRRGTVGVILCATERLALGRDALSDMPLRSGGVSRRHAEIEVARAHVSPRFHLRDAGSRNGTLIGGLPITGRVPLVDQGSFAIGEDCEIHFRVEGTPERLILRVTRGLDRDQLLIAAGEEERIDLSQLAELPLEVRFVHGRPLVEPRAGTVIQLESETVAHGAIQLVHGDVLRADGIEVEVP